MQYIRKSDPIQFAIDCLLIFLFPQIDLVLYFLFRKSMYHLYLHRCMDYQPFSKEMDSRTRNVCLLISSWRSADIGWPAFLNIFETMLNIAYLYYAHVVGWAPATLIGFTSASLTLAKTVLYWLQEYYCNYCAVGHNSLSDLIIYWIIPNGFVFIFLVHPLGMAYCSTGSGSSFPLLSLYG